MQMTCHIYIIELKLEECGFESICQSFCSGTCLYDWIVGKTLLLYFSINTRSSFLLLQSFLFQINWGERGIFHGGFALHLEGHCLTVFPLSSFLCLCFLLYFNTDIQIAFRIYICKELYDLQKALACSSLCDMSQHLMSQLRLEGIVCTYQMEYLRVREFTHLSKGTQQ